MRHFVQLKGTVRSRYVGIHIQLHSFFGNQQMFLERKKKWHRNVSSSAGITSPIQIYPESHYQPTFPKHYPVAASTHAELPKS